MEVTLTWWQLLLIVSVSGSLGVFALAIVSINRGDDTDPAQRAET